LTFDIAIGLLALPRDIGPHPESGKMILAGIGRYGPYVKHESTYGSLSDGDDVLAVGLNRAVALLAEASAKRGGSGRQLGMHPDDDKPVTQSKGRYGPYVKHGRLFASIPAAMNPEEITLEAALPLLAAQAAKKGKKPASAKAGKKAPAKKATAKKKTPKKKAGTRKATKSTAEG
jgi:DNA topoisomerase-1